MGVQFGGKMGGCALTAVALLDGRHVLTGIPFVDPPSHWPFKLPGASAMMP